MKNSEKLLRDFALIRDISVDAAFDSNISPVRCHEMAFLINAGMRMAGYKTYTKDGIRIMEGVYMEHTWVVVPGSLGSLNGAILDFWFGNLRGPRYPKNGQIRVITGYFNQRNYQSRKINYNLAPRTELLAQTLFTPILT